MNFNFKQKECIIVSDFDDVLTYIAPKWFKKIMENKEYFKKFLNLPENFSPNQANNILYRNEFYLDRFLLKKLPFDEKELEECFKKLNDIYIEDPNFYDDLLPSAIARSLSITLGQSMVKKLYIVTRSVESNFDSKQALIQRMFASNMNKVEVVFIDKNEKKSDFIKTLSRVDLLIDDELKNIYDILENCENVRNADIYIPSMGYNKPTKKLRELVESTQNTLTYYTLT